MPIELDIDEDDEGCVRAEVEGRLLLIAIDRPLQRNTFTPRMLAQLAEAFTRLEDDPDLRVGVLHAIGGHFSSGLDMVAVLPLLERGDALFPTGLVEPTDLGTPGYRRRTKPVVAALRGGVGAFGIELALAADVAVAADDCRFTQGGEAGHGLLPLGGAVARLAQRAGLGNALAYLLTGIEFGSEEALRLNMVHKTMRGSHVLDAALRIAHAMAQQSPEAVAAMRAHALLALEHGTAAALGTLPPLAQRLLPAPGAPHDPSPLPRPRPNRFGD